MAKSYKTNKTKPDLAYWLQQEIRNTNNHVNENNVEIFEFKHETNESTISPTTKYSGMKSKSSNDNNIKSKKEKMADSLTKCQTTPKGTAQETVGKYKHKKNKSFWDNINKVPSKSGKPSNSSTTPKCAYHQINEDTNQS
jgi:hypothetical protein